MNLVSIIVPVYNVEKYIKKCLTSLVNQSYSNIEIICVNDGSTDKSLNIILEYKELYSGIIKIINKTNGGLGDARNAGLLKAQGEFIIFIDSDDWIEENTIEMMVENICENNSDIVVCGLRRVDEEGNELSNEQNNLQPIYDSFRSLVNIAPAAWNKMYRRKLFVENNILYPVGLWYEDLPTTSKLFMCSNKITSINVICINYLQRTNSISYSYDERARDIFIVLNEINEFNKLKFNNKFNLEVEYLYIIHTIFAHLFRSVILNKNDLKKEINYTKSYLEKFNKQYYKNKYLKFKNKNNNSIFKMFLIKIGVFCFRMNLYYYLLQIYKIINKIIPIQFKW